MMTRMWLVLNKHDVMLHGFAAGRGIDCCRFASGIRSHMNPRFTAEKNK